MKKLVITIGPRVILVINRKLSPQKFSKIRKSFSKNPKQLEAYPMGEIYRGYSIMPGPNDPGVIIRDPTGRVVGSANNYELAHQWIDTAIDGALQAKATKAKR